MLQLLLLLAGLFLQQMVLHAQSWEVQTESFHRNSIHMMSATTGWTAGTQSVVLKTVNGGNTWSRNSSNIPTVNSIRFANTIWGWLVGEFGSIKTSGDGGNTWIAQTSGIGNHLKSVYCTDINNAWTVGVGGVIRRTTDGGTNWVSSVNTAQLNDVFMADVNNAWTVGDGGAILKTTDGGNTWGLQGDGVTTNNLLSVHFINATTGAAVGINGTVLYTNNGGATWSAVGPATSGLTLNSVYLVNSSGIVYGWAVTPTGRVYSSTNVTAGIPWTLVATISGSPVLKGIYFMDASNGWVGANNGRIYKTANGGTSWSSQTIGGAASFSDLAAIDNSGNVFACAVGSATTIRKTDNINTGFPSWSSAGPTNFSPNITGVPNSVSFPTMLNGWTVFNGGRIYASTDGGATWSRQNNISTTANLLGIHFANTSKGIAVGANGTIAFTNNGGATWTLSGLGTSNTLNSVQFPTATTGYAVGVGGVILKSADAGKIWNVQTSNTSADLYSVSFANAADGYAVGANGTILSTTNGGLNWTNRSSVSGSVSTLNAVSATTATGAYAVGAGGIVLRTLDGGASWTQLNSNTTQDLHAVSFVNDPVDGWVGFAAGKWGTVIKITGGSVCTDITQGTSKHLYDIYFNNGLNGLAVGLHGAVLGTTNSGQDWFSRRRGVSNTYYDISFATATKGITVGEAGKIRTTTDGATWTDQTANSNTSSLLDEVCYVPVANTTTWLAAGANGTIIRSTNDGNNWTVVSSAALTANYLGAIHFPAAANVGTATGYIVGANRTILKTTNGGSTWINIGATATFSGTVPATTGLSSVYFFSDAIGWATGGDKILNTTDGGNSWTVQTLPGGLTAVDLKFINFTDANNGAVLGYATSGGVAGFVTLTTTNGGATWATRSVFDLAGVLKFDDIHFASPTTWYGSGANGAVYRTQDAGSNWAIYGSSNLVSNKWMNEVRFYGVYFTGATSYIAGEDGIIAQTANITGAFNIRSYVISTLYGVHKINDNTAFAVGTTGLIVKTQDDGANWTVKNIAATHKFRSVYFTPDGQTGLVAGGYGVILKTIDGGETWTPKLSGTNEHLYNVYLVSGIGWAVGQNGVILRSMDFGETWTLKHSGGNELYDISWSGSEIFASGQGGFLLKSPDNGETWTTVNAGTVGNLHGIITSNSGGIMIGTDMWRSQTAGNLVWTGFADPTSETFYGGNYFGGVYWAAGSNGTIVRTLAAGLILPNSWGDFTGHAYNETTLLNWKTLQEQNTALFVVERSGNGAQWQEIGSVTATNRSTGDTYSFIDEAPLSGKNYYRLRLLETSGNSSLSKTVTVMFAKNSGATIVVTPTIITHSQTVIQLSDVNTLYDVTIHNGQGGLLQKVAVKGATNTIAMNYARGVYYITVSDNRGVTKTTKVIIH